MNRKLDRGRQSKGGTKSLVSQTRGWKPGPKNEVWQEVGGVFFVALFFHTVLYFVEDFIIISSLAYWTYLLAPVVVMSAYFLFRSEGDPDKIPFFSKETASPSAFKEDGSLKTKAKIGIGISFLVINFIMFSWALPGLVLGLNFIQAGEKESRALRVTYWETTESLRGGETTQLWFKFDGVEETYTYNTKAVQGITTFHVVTYPGLLGYPVIFPGK